MTDTSMVRVPQAGEVAQDGFGTNQIARSAETASTALAAQAKAAVEAGFIIAMRNRRDIDQVRTLLLKACERPAFARGAMYKKPVGKQYNDETGEWENKYAEDLSIRFAEEAVRLMGNIRCDSSAIYDDPKKKIVRFTTVDMETNALWSKDVTIEKTTERSKLKKGQQSLGQRINSYGDVVFLVEATPDDVAKKEGAEASKSWRDQVLKLVPADIKEESRAAVRATNADKTAKDPEGERKRILDAFSDIGVQPLRLKEYLGHELDTLSPKEIESLRGIWAAINDGDTTWYAVMDEKRETDAANASGQKGDEPASKSEDPKGKQTLGDVAAKSKAKREDKQAEKPAAREPGSEG